MNPGSIGGAKRSISFSNLPVAFGRFRLLGKIGAGAMAAVYRAEMQSMRGFSKIVAVKILHMHLIEDPELRQLFFNEARLGGFLTHPNIVETFDFNQQDNRYYLAMEYVNGPSFSQILSRYRSMDRTIPIDVVLQLMVQICHGLNYAHRAMDHRGRILKMVHRDLKPSNLLVNQYGQVKIADFGVARAICNVNINDTIASGMIKGSIRYLSPEQAGGWQQIDHRSDVFAVGLILFELLTNRCFYEGNQSEHILRVAQQPDITETLKYFPQMPLRSRILDILTRALAFKKECRFDSAMEMADELKKILAVIPHRTNLVEWIKNIGQAKCIAMQNHHGCLDGAKVDGGTVCEDDSMTLVDQLSQNSEKEARTVPVQTPEAAAVAQDKSGKPAPNPLEGRRGKDAGADRQPEQASSTDKTPIGDKVTCMWRPLGSATKNLKQEDPNSSQNTIATLFNTPRHTYDVGTDIFELASSRRIAAPPAVKSAIVFPMTTAANVLMPTVRHLLHGPLFSSKKLEAETDKL